jgi:hypothetical protein
VYFPSQPQFIIFKSNTTLSEFFVCRYPCDYALTNAEYSIMDDVNETKPFLDGLSMSSRVLVCE